jgi:hypothetical protein
MAALAKARRIMELIDSSLKNDDSKVELGSKRQRTE